MTGTQFHLRRLAVHFYLFNAITVLPTSLAFNHINTIKVKAEAFKGRQRAHAEDGVTTGGLQLAPEWLRQERDTLYFPVVHWTVLAEVHREVNPELAFSHSEEDHKGRRKLAQMPVKDVVAAYRLGGGVVAAGGYYVTIALGSGRQTFNVEIDTGSDLLWVPCDCNEGGCASRLGYGTASLPFNSSTSTSAQQPSCTSDLCSGLSSSSQGGVSISLTCINATGPLQVSNSSVEDSLGEGNGCGYQAVYGDGRSTAGSILQDKLMLDLNTGLESAQITFGCGNKQSGKLRDSASFDGVIGLGRSNLSVLNQLASKGLMNDSFAICMEGDGTGGHLMLGRYAAPLGAYFTLQLGLSGETFYQINVTSCSFNNTNVGDDSVYPFPAILDTSASFTSLPRALYDPLAGAILEGLGSPETFQNDERLTCVKSTDFFTEVIGILPEDEWWNYAFLLPNISLFALGGSPWFIPAFNYLVVDPSESAICIAALPTDGTAIIGDTWLRNFNIIFDNVNGLVSWLAINCTTGNRLYGNQNSNSTQLVAFPSDATPAEYNASGPPSPSEGLPALTAPSPPIAGSPPNLNPTVVAVPESSRGFTPGPPASYTASAILFGLLLFAL